ncbi:MAG: phospho-N-acetylmuramoyl-pentapeptide-transferase [candidate division WOR-3 bacterium]
MLYYLLYPLKKYSIIFNLFGYVTVRGTLAGTFSFLIVLIFSKNLISYLKSKRLIERISEDVPERHKVKEGTPTMGGVIIIIGTITGLILWGDWGNPFLYAIIFLFISFGVLGLIDDIYKMKGVKKKGISKRIKIIYQSIATLIFFFIMFFLFEKSLLTKTQILFFKNFLLNFGLLYPVFLYFVLVGTTNAVNLTDGLDGLAVGVSATVVAVYIILAYVGGHKVISNYLNILFISKSWELAVFGASLLGALLGFLWYNFYPAEIFMGDTGSQAIGGAIAGMAILTKQELLLPIAGGVFLIEALSVIIQVIYFKKTGKRVFLCAPIHHHFELKGLKEPKIVIRFWLLSIIFSLVALSTLKIR